MYITIRALGKADIPLIQTIGRAAYEPYYEYLWKPGGMEWYMEYCFNDARLLDDMKNENLSYFLAETNTAEQVGFLKVYWQKSVPTSTDTKATLLEKIYLLPEYIGKGKGRFLINWLSAKCKKMGQDYLWLDVMKSGPRKAYEAAGFEEVCDKEIPFELMKPEERHLWVMARRL